MQTFYQCFRAKANQPLDPTPAFHIKRVVGGANDGVLVVGAWAAIEPHLPKNKPGARRADDRRVISDRGRRLAPYPSFDRSHFLKLKSTRAACAAHEALRRWQELPRLRAWTEACLRDLQCPITVHPAVRHADAGRR